MGRIGPDRFVRAIRTERVRLARPVDMIRGRRPGQRSDLQRLQLPLAANKMQRGEGLGGLAR